VQAVRDLGGEVVLHGDDYDAAYEHARAGGRERLVLRAPLRRPGRDRRPGHDRHGDRCARPRPHRRGVRAGGRRRADRRHRRLHQVSLPAGAVIGVEPRTPRDARVVAPGQARDARQGRHLRRRRRGAARRRGDLPPRASTSTRCCWSTPTRSAPASRTSSRTRARSSSRRARSRSPAMKKYVAREQLRASGWSRSTAAPTSTSTACATSPSAPRSARSARRCSRWRSRRSPGSFLAFCGVLGSAQRHRVQLPLRERARGA
jgi:hypothetical protein